MSLARASFRGAPLPLRGPGPWSGAELRVLAGQKFVLPSDDPWFQDAAGPARAYLEGSREAWLDHPEHMDFLDPTSPVHQLKRHQRDLCLAGWGLRGGEARRVLDVGCGVGRFATWYLDRGADVFAADPDVDSLRRLVWHAGGRPGRLDVFRASAHRPPEVEVDHLVLAEVLNYVPDAAGALAASVGRLRPGGTAWISLEARWGWVLAPDAPAGAVRAALEGGPIDLPGRWVRTFDEAQARALVEGVGLRVDALVPSHWTYDGPLENVLSPEVSLAQLLDLEARCRRHPVLAPLHRLWLVAAHRPE